MHYLRLDESGYVEAIFSSEEEQELPKYEELENIDTSGQRLYALHWDGEKLTLDEDRLAELEARERRKEQEAARASALREAQDALVTAQINTIAVDDDTALRWRLLYPEWAVGRVYIEGDRAQYEDRLFRCLQGHSSQAGWEPVNVPALWTEVCESHAGTADDPIPYSGNMALEAGKYYAQDGVTYRCTRDTGIPVYNPLADLVGLYVEVAL